MHHDSPLPPCDLANGDRYRYAHRAVPGRMRLGFNMTAKTHDLLAFVSQIARFATTEADLVEKYGQICLAAHVDLGLDIVTVYELDERGFLVRRARAQRGQLQHEPWTSQRPFRAMPESEWQTPRTRMPHFFKALFHDMSQRPVGLLTVENGTQVEQPQFDALLIHLCQQLACARKSSHLFAEMKQRTDFLEMLNQVSNLAFKGGALPEQLKRITEYVAARFPVSVASIVLLNPDQTHFTLEIFSGDAELHAPQNWPVSVGVCGRAVRDRRPQLIEDVKADPDYFTGNPKIQSEFIIPIITGNRVVGVLNMESELKGVFTPYIQLVLQQVASQVAAAISQASTHEQLVETSNELERLNRELTVANQRLQELSLHDSLTGIPNRRYFDENLSQECRRARRTHTSLALVILDIDHFKRYNDCYGHLAGDQCLKQVAMVLADHAKRANEWTCRLGGEEFAMVSVGLSFADVSEWMEQVRRDIELIGLEHRTSGVAEHLTASLGLTFASDVPDRDIARELFQQADANLYRAKTEGRNRLIASHFEEPMSTAETEEPGT